MEDKTFEFMEKLYNRMEEGFKEVKGHMNDLESKMVTKDDLQKVEQRLEQNMLRMEQKYDDKIGILFDACREIPKRLTACGLRCRHWKPKLMNMKLN